MIEVVLIDGDALMRAGIQRILAEEAGIDVIGEAESAEDGIRMAKARPPTVVVLDVHVGRMGGLEAIRRLARVDERTRVLAIGGRPDGPFPARALELGARGYLSRAAEPSALVRAVRAVSRGERWVSEEVARTLALNLLDPASDPVVALTPRELSVVVMLGEGRRRGEISQHLCVSPKTVSTYRTRALRKLGASSDVEIAHLCMRHGLLGGRGASVPA